MGGDEGLDCGSGVLGVQRREASPLPGWLCGMNERRTSEVTPGFLEVGMEKGERLEMGSGSRFFVYVILFFNGFSLKPIDRDGM